jgi:DNA-binding CsgD family transcriptional regulator
MAIANYHEAIRLARETAQRTDLAAALAGLAWIEARQGNGDARGHADQARSLCQELGAGIYDLWALAALADLDLGLGRPAAALVHLTRYQDKLNSLQIKDADLSPAPELVAVQLRLGDRKAADSAAREICRQAAAKQQPWALARAARCEGLLATDVAFADHFQVALDLHAQTADAFEAARTHLAYGSRLRRSRHRVAARVQLRQALDVFERLGAMPWADQAAAELAATGETARRRDPSTVDQLTPQELQIAVLLARGDTTREVAAALFISPKTVEHHTSRFYRKLGITARQQLSAALEARG